jgi:Iron-binding zinc finger CDGSH type
MKAAPDLDDLVCVAVPCIDGCLAIGDPDVRAERYPDGPVLVRAAGSIVTPDGVLTPVPRAVVAVCRCGHSSRGAFCDGTHRFVRGR